MSTHELTTAIYQHLNKVKVLVITIAVIAAIAMILYAKQKSEADIASTFGI